MKNLLVLSLFILFIQCETLDKLTQFNIHNQSEFTINATTVVDTPFDVYTPDITTNSTSEFSNNNTNANLVESIKLKSLNLRITTPADGNFNFLKSARIFISASGLDEVEIAHIYDLTDDDLTLINLDTTGAELKAYVKKDSYTLRVETVTDQVVTQDHTIETNAVFRVDAKILGL